LLLRGDLIMKKLFYAAMFYLVFGLCSGLFYREFTKSNEFTGLTQLKLAHTHILVLGFFMFFILTLFEKVFSISESKWFNKFFVVYNVGALLTLIMFLVIGVAQVRGITPAGPFNGIAGLGHVIITIGFVFLFLVLKERILKEDESIKKDKYLAAA
jgi:hypothetical protein